MPRPSALDEESVLYLSAVAGDGMEIHLITSDPGLHARLRSVRPRVFKAIPPTIEPHTLRQGIQEAAARAYHRTGVGHEDEGQELAPGMMLKRGLTRWIVTRGAVKIALTRQETEILAALLAADGQKYRLMRWSTWRALDSPCQRTPWKSPYAACEAS